MVDTNPSQTIKAAFSFVLITAIFGLAGCGSNDGRLSLGGTVAVDGKPVEAGSINFVPANGTSSPVAAGAVADGKFWIPASGGVKPGTFKVTFGMPIDAPTLTPSSKPKDMANFDLGAAVKRAQDNAPKVPPSYSLEISIQESQTDLKLQFSTAEEE